MDLKGKTAIVTGASRGIGKAIALELAARGANLAAIATSVDSAKAVAEEAAKLGVKSRAFGVDVADANAVKNCIDEVLKEFGTLDILVNNAGITRDNLLVRMSDEEWDQVMAVNLKGVFNFLRAAARPMMKAKSGRIINISSVSGITGNPGQANYSAAKAGILGLTKAAALELAGRGVTVNAVAPGFIRTDMTKGLEGQMDAILSKIPLGRMGEAKEIAAAVGYLASQDAAYTTGQVLVVDGGLSM